MKPVFSCAPGTNLTGPGGTQMLYLMSCCFAGAQQTGILIFRGA